MRAQMLKMAGVKTDKEFYKLFPDEESFMKKHGKAFKKAQMGAFIGGEKTTNPQVMNFNQFYNDADKQVTGTNNHERQQQVYQQQMLAAQQKPQGGGGGIMGSISQMLPALESLGGEAEYGIEIPKAQWGINSQQNYPSVGFSGTGQRPQVQQINSNSIGRSDIDTSVPGSQTPIGVDIPKGPGIMNTVGKFIGPAGKLIEGFQALKAEKENLRGANQWKDVSALSLQASKTRPEQTERRYTRPEDIQNTGEEFFPIYGVGTNVLAKDGAEIQNTYAPNTLYDDLEYDKIQQNGGKTPFDWNAASQVGTGLARNLTGNNAGATIGEGVGDLVGMIPGVGPVADAIITPVATAIGGLLDRNQSKIKKAQAATTRNMTGMAAGAMGQGLQQQYQGYMRTGGNIRQNNMDELQVYEGEAEQISTNPYLPDGGETVMFKGPSHADGGMDISYGNSPVEVEGGEPAVKLQDGGSAGENLVVYGNLPIPKGMLEDPDAKNKKFKNYANILSKKEASQNKLVDKTTKNLEDFKPLTTFDKIKMNSYDANLMGANMKLKDLAQKKIDAAALQNAINDTAKEHGIVAEDLAKGKYKIDRKAMKAKAQGGINLPYFENLLPEKEHPIYPGEFINAESNTVSNPADYQSLIQKYFPKEEWENATKVMTAESSGNPQATNKNKGSEDRGLFQINTKWHPEVYKQGDIYDPEYNIKAAADIWKKRGWKEWSSAKKVLGENWWKKSSTVPTATPIQVDPTIETVTPITTPAKAEQTWGKGFDTSAKQKPVDIVEPTKRNVLMDLYNQALPFLRPTDQEQLDPNQLAGEMYSMMSNQLEPVQAQSYQPQLDVPYDISFQDQLNEITSQQRAAQRTAGYNPAAQAMIAGQAYGPKSGVLAEQFRTNQAMKDKVYSGNRATMNDAQLKNLAIYDQQYGRQEQAKSNTKANTLAALSSMSDKYAKNKLENRQLGIYENMYNYRYDSKGRAINMNPLQQFMPDGTGGQATMSDAEQLAYYDEKAQEIKDKKKEEKKARAEAMKKRNGGIIKALKTL